MRHPFTLALVLLAALGLASCELIGDILQAGLWVLLLLVLFVAAIIWLIIRLLR